MKTLAWHRYLEGQLRDHGKKCFSVTELAHVAGTSLQAINVELSRLRRRGVIERYGRGIYGLPGRLAPEDLVARMDSRAYVTGMAALFRHGCVTQVPARFTCFTNRRHGRLRERTTPAGRFLFVCVKRPVYDPPAAGVLVPPEQALLDFIYITRRNGADPVSLVTFRDLSHLDVSQLCSRAVHYPKTVRGQAERIAGGPQGR
jgi:hypothetical protein